MDWIEDIINHTLNNYRERKIILWGKYSVSNEIKEIFENKYNINDICYVDSDETLVDNVEVFNTDFISGRKNEFYIVIPLAVHDSIKKLLLEGGYEKDIDYYYFCDCILKITEDYYEDMHGNKFIGKRDGIKFCFSGWDSTIKIGKDAKFDKNLVLYMHNEETFEIGENVQFVNSILKFSRGFKKIYIGNNSRLNNCVLEVCKNGELIIKCNVNLWGYSKYTQRIVVDLNGKLVLGENTTIGFNSNIICTKNSEIIIGNDCMFSWNLNILSNDCHTIFDVKNKQPINISTEKLKRSVNIEDHVWIGMNCIVLDGTYIGKGSIVAAGSIVKGQYPNNCMIAGSMAKIIKRDVAWYRNDGEENIEVCGDYANITKDNMLDSI